VNNSDITLVVLCAGNSSRFAKQTKKQWLYIADEPLWLYVVNNLKSLYNFAKIVVVSSKSEVEYMKNFSCEYSYIEGGDSRQESMKNSLNKVDSDYVLVTDVARCCIDGDMISRVIASKGASDCVVPFIKAVDTVVYENSTIDRDNIKLIQTPQLSRTDILKKALDQDVEFTDDSSAIKSIGGSISYVAGSSKSLKLTHESDLRQLSCLARPSLSTSVGFGLDTHAFESDKEMFLGGIRIEGISYGFKAHSDGDVLIHSIIDALLGAVGAGDIGEFFPDNDPKYKGADSQELLRYIVTFVKSVGYEIVNVDTTIIAEQPKITPYKDLIRYNLAELLEIAPSKCNIKATTSERLGFIGKKEGVTVHSVANLKYYDWSNR
jgi:2-C-methyl-D-erythritol 4-phosphate cytidylyltransferase/2-C-methyl-D-erythritol 2,4-cyclodiphosphate synthase